MAGARHRDPAHARRAVRVGIDARPLPMSGAVGVAENGVRHPVAVGPLADDATVDAVGGAEDAVVPQAGERRRGRPRRVGQIVDRPHHRARHREDVAVIGRRHDQRAVEVDGLDRGADGPIELPRLDERPERVAGVVGVVDAPRLDHQEVRPARRREDLDGLGRHVDDARLAEAAIVLVIHVRRLEEPQHAAAGAERLEPGGVVDVGIALRLQLGAQVPAVRPGPGQKVRSPTAQDDVEPAAESGVVARSAGHELRRDVVLEALVFRVGVDRRRRGVG